MPPIEQITPEMFLEYYFPVEIPTHYALDFDAEFTPAQYLKFAEQDLQSDPLERGAINAVGNAKRALHLQVDTICRGYGCPDKATKFPPKIEFLRDLGMVAPDVLERLNHSRNAVEHDYSSPSFRVARDFIDIVQLFLYATFTYIDCFPQEIILTLGTGDIGSEEEVHKETGLPIIIEAELEKNTGYFWLYNGDSIEANEKPLLCVRPSDEHHRDWLRALIEVVPYFPQNRYSPKLDAKDKPPFDDLFPK